MAHPKSQHWGGRDRYISKFEANLVYRVSSRTARATQRNSASKTKKEKRKKKIKKEKNDLCVLVLLEA